MSSKTFKNKVTSKQLIDLSYLTYDNMDKEDLTLNKHQGLISHLSK